MPNFRQVSDFDLATSLAMCKPLDVSWKVVKYFLLLRLLTRLSFLVVVGPAFADHRFLKNITHHTSRPCQRQKVLENSKCVIKHFPSLLNTSGGWIATTFCTELQNILRFAWHHYARCRQQREGEQEPVGTGVAAVHQTMVWKHDVLSVMQSTFH